MPRGEAAPPEEREASGMDIIGWLTTSRCGLWEPDNNSP